MREVIRPFRWARQVCHLRKYLVALFTPCVFTEPAPISLFAGNISSVLAPARAPPIFKSVVIRHRLGEPVQAELFDAR